MPKNIYKEFCVYHYLRPVDSETAKAGTPYYVGKGKGRERAYAKHHKGIHVPKDRKFIVFPEENMYEDDAFTLEISDIKKYGRKDLGTGILHNRTDGGEGLSGIIRSPPTQATKDKIGASRIGRNHTQEAKNKTGDGNRGKKRTQEQKDKMGNLKRGRPQSPDHIAKRVALNTGKKRSQKVIDKTVAFHTGRKRSPETKAKMSNSQTGKIIPQETRDKISDTKTGKNLPPFTQEHKDRISDANMGKKWFHNPETNKSTHCFPDNVPDGYIPGRK